MSVNLSPCLMTWNSLSPTTYSCAEDLTTTTPPGALDRCTDFQPLSPTSNPFASSVFTSCFRDESVPMLAPTDGLESTVTQNEALSDSIPVLSNGLNGTDTNTFTTPCIYKQEDESEGETEENNNIKFNSGSYEEATSSSNNSESPEKILTTLETIRSSPKLDFNKSSEGKEGLDQVTHVESISPVVSYIGPGQVPTINGFHPPRTTAISNGLYGNEYCNGTTTTGGCSTESYTDRYYPKNPGSYGSYGSTERYGEDMSNGGILDGAGSSLVYGSGTAYPGSSLTSGMGMTSQLKPCDLSLSCYTTTSSPSPYSPISPTGFTSTNSCMYSAWKAAGDLTAAAAAASGIPTGGITPSSPGDNPLQHTLNGNRLASPVNSVGMSTYPYHLTYTTESSMCSRIPSGNGLGLSPKQPASGLSNLSCTNLYGSSSNGLSISSNLNINGHRNIYSKGNSNLHIFFFLCHHTIAVPLYVRILSIKRRGSSFLFLSLEKLQGKHGMGCY